MECLQAMILHLKSPRSYVYGSISKAQDPKPTVQNLFSQSLNLVHIPTLRVKVQVCYGHTNVAKELWIIHKVYCLKLSKLSVSSVSVWDWEILLPPQLLPAFIPPVALQPPADPEFSRNLGNLWNVTFSSCGKLVQKKSFCWLKKFILCCKIRSLCTEYE